MKKRAFGSPIGFALLFAFAGLPSALYCGGRGVAVAATTTATARPGNGALLAAVCYHRFGVETRKDPYRISLKRLAEQLRWLRREGWKSVSLTQVAAALDGQASALPRKGVLLTVDDGYKAGARAVPVFERYGFRAVYFIVPSVLGKGAFLTYRDLRTLEARGEEIGSHTLTHPDLAKVPKGMSVAAYVRWVSAELEEPKRQLEAALGHPVVALAWPYGAYNPALAAAALRVGYRQLWTVSGGLNSVQNLDRSRLRRIILMGHPPLATFAKRLRSRPLRPFVGGIGEGELIYRSQLPLHVMVPKGVAAAVGGKSRELDASPGFTLKSATKGGFHYLNLAEEDGGGSRSTPFLFQVARNSWRPYFEALSSVAAVSRTPTALPEALSPGATARTPLSAARPSVPPLSRADHSAHKP